MQGIRIGALVFGVTPEQEKYFDQAERMYGRGRLSPVIEDAKEDLSRRNERDGVVRSGNRVIGFVVPAASSEQ